MIEDLDKNKLDKLFGDVSDPNLLFEENDADYDADSTHQHQHNHQTC